MASLIKEKPSATSAFTISLGGLATSTVGVGRQSTLIDNSTTQYPAILIFVNIKLGTSPLGNTGIYLHGIRASTSGTPIRDDGAGTTDAGLTVLNAESLGGLQVAAAPSTGDVLKKTFLFLNPGPTWGIAIWHNTGVALDADNGDHVIEWLGLTPEAQ